MDDRGAARAGRRRRLRGIHSTGDGPARSTTLPGRCGDCPAHPAHACRMLLPFPGQWASFTPYTHGPSRHPSASVPDSAHEEESQEEAEVRRYQRDRQEGRRSSDPPEACHVQQGQEEMLAGQGDAFPGNRQSSTCVDGLHHYASVHDWTGTTTVDDLCGRVRRSRLRRREQPLFHRSVSLLAQALCSFSDCA